MKNILIFEDSSKAKFGGGQKVTLEVINILKEKYNLILVDCLQNSVFKQKAAKFVSDVVELNCYGKIIGGNKSAFSLGLKEIILFPFLTIKNLIKLNKYFKDKNLDKNNTIIYSTTKKNLLLAFILNKLFGFNYIYHAHTYDDKKSFFFKIIYPAYKNAKKIICVSDFIKNNINLKNCITIYNPIKQIKINPKKIENKRKIIVASFSTLIKLKGIEYFMQSYEFLKNKQNVEYWIFGDGNEKEYLKRFENQNVKLKGFTTNSEEIMLNNVDIVVAPSIIQEACPMVPLEAFKCGIPVISTNIGGQAEIVKDGEVGFLVDIRNPEQIAQKIDYLINNPKKYEFLSKNAIKYSQKFDVINYKKHIIEVFDENIAAG